MLMPLQSFLASPTSDHVFKASAKIWFKRPDTNILHVYAQHKASHCAGACSSVLYSASCRYDVVPDIKLFSCQWLCKLNECRERRPSSLAKRCPSLFKTRPPTPRRASAARNLIFASASSGFTRPVGCTWTHSKSMDFAPMPSPILMPSPVQCSPFVVGKWIRSGLYFASNESDEKSAPKPPVAKMTGPNSWKHTPFFS